MPTRRSVLKSATLPIIGSALPAGVIAKQVLPTPFTVVYENGIAESVAFKDALKYQASAIYALHQDPAETFRELARVRQPGAVVLGCSKGAAAFVLGELAREQGGRMQIYAEHRYLPGKVVQHTLRLADSGIERSGPADNWGRTIAGSLGSELPPATVEDYRVIKTATSRPVNSPGYLVTWAILPEILK